MAFSAQALKQQARQLGFNLVGITRAVPSPTLDAYLRWVDAGLQGTMGYLSRPDRIERRQDLNVILPNVQSLVIVGLDYQALTVTDDLLNDPSRGRIASYAWGMDYHDVMQVRLEQLAQWMQLELADLQYRVYVDTGAILERSHAQQAGMGFIGKNTMLIHPRRGSYFFIGEILTDIEFDDYDPAHRATMCGTCTRCLSACPTDAFPEPYVLDSRLCISYHTIENKGWIDLHLRRKFGNWVFGCDICQDVCPFQRFALSAKETAFLPINENHVAPKITDLLSLDEETFRERYHGTPIFRIKRERLVRNACIVAGNWGNSQAIPYLIHLLYDASPLIRGHASWALFEIMGWESKNLLSDLYYREADEQVRSEIEALLA